MLFYLHWVLPDLEKLRRVLSSAHREGAGPKIIEFWLTSAWSSFGNLPFPPPTPPSPQVCKGGGPPLIRNFNIRTNKERKKNEKTIYRECYLISIGFFLISKNSGAY